MSAAEEAIARAKAIAARLAGTGASAAIEPSSAVNVNAVADAALAAAFGDAGAGTSSAIKRKRWSDDYTGKCRILRVVCALSQALNIQYSIYLLPLELKNPY